MSESEQHAGLVPTGDDLVQLWALIEATWHAVGPEADRARRSLAARPPGDDGQAALEVIDPVLESAFARWLVAASAPFTAEQLVALDRVVERLLYDLDRADIHEFTDGSDDGFLYARGFIVAMGQEFYQAVLRDPAVAVCDAEFEDLCYFFAHRHEERWGTFPETGSGISRETCSNAAGWEE